MEGEPGDVCRRGAWGRMWEGSLGTRVGGEPGEEAVLAIEQLDTMMSSLFKVCMSTSLSFLSSTQTPFKQFTDLHVALT